MLNVYPAAFGSGLNREAGFSRAVFATALPSDAAKRARSGTPERRITRPDKIVAVLSPVLSRADFTTGRMLSVDGGTPL